MSEDTLFINDKATEGADSLLERRAVRLPVSRWVNLLQFMFVTATMLFFILSPAVLRLMNWHYLVGGPEFQKVHIATYLLITIFVCLWLLDPRFRGNVT